MYSICFPHYWNMFLNISDTVFRSFDNVQLICTDKHRRQILLPTDTCKSVRIYCLFLGRRGFYWRNHQLFCKLLYIFFLLFYCFNLTFYQFCKSFKEKKTHGLLNYFVQIKKQIINITKVKKIENLKSFVNG